MAVIDDVFAQKENYIVANMTTSGYFSPAWATSPANNHAAPAHFIMGVFAKWFPQMLTALGIHTTNDTKEYCAYISRSLQIVRCSVCTYFSYIAVNYLLNHLTSGKTIYLVDSIFGHNYALVTSNNFPYPRGSSIFNDFFNCIARDNTGMPNPLHHPRNFGEFDRYCSQLGMNVQGWLAFANVVDLWGRDVPVKLRNYIKGNNPYREDDGTPAGRPAYMFDGNDIAAEFQTNDAYRIPQATVWDIDNYTIQFQKFINDQWKIFTNVSYNGRTVADYLLYERFRITMPPDHEKLFMFPCDSAGNELGIQVQPGGQINFTFLGLPIAPHNYHHLTVLPLGLHANVG